MRIYDAFPGKREAQQAADGLRKDGVQYVRVKRVNEGRLKWGVFIGGRNSSMY